jgi:hypothetical protein
MKSCYWCSLDFDPRVSYQIYCSPQCRELATKEKISSKQQVARARSRSAKKRKCAGGCGTIISIYNNNGFCGNCMVNKRKVDQMLKELKGLFDYEQEK